MPAWKRILIGWLAALMPVLLMIVKIDIGFIVNNPDISTAHLIGFAIKYICLGVIGAVVAYLNDEATKPLTVFQIGLSAPALLTSFITSNGITSMQREYETQPKPIEKAALVIYTRDGRGFMTVADVSSPEPAPETGGGEPEPGQPENLTERIIDAVGDVKDAVTGEVYEKAIAEKPDQNPVMDSITGDGYRQLVPENAKAKQGE